MKWIEILKGELPKDRAEDILVLFETGEWRRFMEEDLPFGMITHYMIVPSLKETNDESTFVKDVMSSFDEATVLLNEYWGLITTRPVSLWPDLHREWFKKLEVFIKKSKK